MLRGCEESIDCTDINSFQNCEEREGHHGYRAVSVFTA